MIDDNTICLSLFCPLLTQYTQSHYFSDRTCVYKNKKVLELYRYFTYSFQINFITKLKMKKRFEVCITNETVFLSIKERSQYF